MIKHAVLLVLLLSSFSTYAEGVELGCSPNNITCDNCPKYQTIFPVEEFSKKTTSLDIEADTSEIFEENYYLNGNVKVRSDDLFIAGDDVQINSINKTINAKDNVRFQDESFLILADELSAKRDGDKLTAKAFNADYQNYKLGKISPNGFAKTIIKNPSDIILNNATFSLCPLGKKDWFIKAKQINLNQDTNRGLAKHATLKFFSVPIFYLPRYGWVLNGRGSGFLTPSFSAYTEANTTNSDGTVTQHGRSNRFRIPYYFNIAPDRDLVFALAYMASRGLTYEGKYRQLVKPRILPDREDSILEIESKYLARDKITGLPRWLLYSSIDQDLTERLKISATYNRISDQTYFTDIERTAPVNLTLKSSLSLNYSNPENSFSASALTEHEQTITAAPGYQRALSLSTSKTFRAKKRQPITVNLSSTKFVHEEAGNASGVRSNGSVRVSRDLTRDFPKISTKAGIGITHYQLKNTNNITRQVSEAGISFGFPFNYKSNLYGSALSNTLTPSISYNYRQKILQGNIPIFDTEDKYDNIITFAALTSGERYTGLDRVTNANDITLGFETNTTYNEKTSITTQTAQTFYADDEVVSNTGGTNYETRKSYSDIVSAINFTTDNIIFTNDIQFNPDKNEIIKKRNSISYKITPKKFISIALTDEGETEEAEIYGAFPINNSFHIFGALNKITSSGFIKQETTGIAYESCCWAARIAHFKDGGGGSTDYSYSTGFEIVFKGLGSTATPLKGRIEGNIPYYSSKLR